MVDRVITDPSLGLLSLCGVVPRIPILVTTAWQAFTASGDGELGVLVHFSSAHDYCEGFLEPWSIFPLCDGRFESVLASAATAALTYCATSLVVLIFLVIKSSLVSFLWQRPKILFPILQRNTTIVVNAIYLHGIVMLIVTIARLKDRIRQQGVGEGGQWEPIKIPRGNSAYVSTVTQHAPLLTRSIPNSY
jgi:hypothetical protein